MSDNAELIGWLREMGTGAHPDQINPDPHYMRAAVALVRAELERAEQLDALGAEITALQCDLRTAAASEAAMRDALMEIAKGMGRFSRDPIVHAKNTIDDMKSLAQAALFTPISTLAQRYEAVVAAARRCAANEWIELDAALAALDHPTPGKDQES